MQGTWGKKLSYFSHLALRWFPRQRSSVVGTSHPCCRRSVHLPSAGRITVSVFSPAKAKIENFDVYNKAVEQRGILVVFFFLFPTRAASHSWYKSADPLECGSSIYPFNQNWGARNHRISCFFWVGQNQNLSFAERVRLWRTILAILAAVPNQTEHIERCLEMERGYVSWSWGQWPNHETWGWDTGMFCASLDSSQTSSPHQKGGIKKFPLVMLKTAMKQTSILAALLKYRHKTLHCMGVFFLCSQVTCRCEETITGKLHIKFMALLQCVRYWDTRLFQARGPECLSLEWTPHEDV